VARPVGTASPRPPAAARVRLQLGSQSSRAHERERANGAALRQLVASQGRAVASSTRPWGSRGGCLNGVSGDVVYMHITRRINCVHQWHSPLPWTNARSYSIGDHRGSCAQHVMNARTRGLQR
jgi:hypothetical protein